ncbi:MAG: hypothetical protein ABSG54_17265 [Terriglobia bacterium]|jgi:hypothetical protein
MRKLDGWRLSRQTLMNPSLKQNKKAQGNKASQAEPYDTGTPENIAAEFSKMNGHQVPPHGTSVELEA